MGLAATDKHIYVTDMYNRRVLRCRLEYATEKTCAIR